MKLIDCLTRKKDDPEHDTVHQPYEAFNQGFEARELNVKKRLNPYKPFSEEWRWWNDGWDHAHGQERYATKRRENVFMRDNGLGPEDMRSDLVWPQ